MGGPTHLMLIGGAGLSLVATLLLTRRAISPGGRRGAGAAPQHPGVSGVRRPGHRPVGVPGRIRLRRRTVPVGAAPPMLIAAAAAMSLVVTRLFLGRFATFGAIAFAFLIRGLVALVVGPVLGAPHSWFALYLGSAIVVELLGLTPLVKRPILFGAVAGLGVGSVGMWLESFWVDAVFRNPWPQSMWGARRWPPRCRWPSGWHVRCAARHRAHRPETAAAPRRHRDRRRHRAGHRRRRRQRSQHHGAGGCQRADHPHRRAERRRPATGERRRQDHAGQPDQRRPPNGCPSWPGRASSTTSVVWSSTTWSGSARATTGPRAPFRCGAPGRRCCACRTAGPWPPCRSSCPPTPPVSAPRRPPGAGLDLA